MCRSVDAASIRDGRAKKRVLKFTLGQGAPPRGILGADYRTLRPLDLGEILVCPIRVHIQDLQHFEAFREFAESVTYAGTTPDRLPTPTPGTNFFFLFNRLRSAILKSFARFSFVVCLTVPNFVPIGHRLVFCCFRSLCGSHLLTKAAPAETLITLE